MSEPDMNKRCRDCFYFHDIWTDVGRCMKTVDEFYILMPPHSYEQGLHGGDMGCDWEHFEPKDGMEQEDQSNDPA